MRVTISKIKELEGALAPFNKPIGHTRTGKLLIPVAEGTSVVVIKDEGGYFQTSTVQKIISETPQEIIVETYNSVYKICILD